MKRKRVLILNFGRKNGHTDLLINDLFKSIDKKIQMYSFETYSINFQNAPIKYCLGCCNCFNYGRCILDEHDKFYEVREKILNSDLIIIGTPIYMNNITGSMKSFLDRLSYWAHTMMARGCPTIIVISSGNNGIDEVSRYLFNILSFLGMNIIGLLQIKNYERFNDKQEILISNITNRYKQIVKESTKRTNSYLEECFKKFYFIYKNSEGNNFEMNYWKDIFKKNYKSYYNLINDMSD